MSFIDLGIQVLIAFLIVGLVLWLIGFVGQRVPGIPGWIIQIAQVVIAVMFVIWLLRLLLGATGHKALVVGGEVLPYLIG